MIGVAGGGEVDVVEGRSRERDLGDGEAGLLQGREQGGHGARAVGDASVEAAAANGGITKIRYADYEILNVLGIYREFEVRVSGD